MMVIGLKGLVVVENGGTPLNGFTRESKVRTGVVFIMSDSLGLDF